MKHKFKLFGIIALAAIIGFSMLACDPNTGDGDGTAPTITTTSLPNGTVGTAYSQTLAATGDPTISWSIDSGTLPAGLTLSGATISGTPTTANTFNFTVKATNDAGNDTKALSIVIAAPQQTEINLGEGEVLHIKGKINETIKFEVIDEELGAGLSISRALVGNNQFAVTGVIDDNGTKTWVSGTYNPIDRTYSVSTSSGTHGRRYSITGTFDESGDPTGSIATVLENDAGTWSGESYIVDEDEPVTIEGTAYLAEAGGIPALARGNWYAEGTDSSDNEYIGQSLINEWNMVSYVAKMVGNIRSYTSTTATVIEVADAGAGKYNVIIAYPLYALGAVETGKARIAAAIADFFSGTGITPQEQELNAAYSDPSYYIDTFNNNFVVHWSGFDDWSLVNLFYSTNQLDRYLISQDVEPALWYESRQFQLSGGELIMPKWTTAMADKFNTLAEARTANHLDELNDVYTFTRNIADLAITTTYLPPGEVGTAYSKQLTARGEGSITWTLDSGTLPTGLTLSTTGLISGTPTLPGKFDLTVKASNSGNKTKVLSLVIVGDYTGTWTNDTAGYQLILTADDYSYEFTLKTFDDPDWVNTYKGWCLYNEATGKLTLNLEEEWTLVDIDEDEYEWLTPDPAIGLLVWDAVIDNVNQFTFSNTTDDEYDGVWTREEP